MFRVVVGVEASLGTSGLGQCTNLIYPVPMGPIRVGGVGFEV